MKVHHWEQPISGTAGPETDNEADNAAMIRLYCWLFSGWKYWRLEITRFTLNASNDSRLSPSSSISGCIRLVRCVPVHANDDAFASPSDADAFFQTHVEPLLKQHCYKCHSHAAEGGERWPGPRFTSRLAAGGDWPGPPSCPVIPTRAF